MNVRPLPSTADPGDRSGATALGLGVVFVALVGVSLWSAAVAWIAQVASRVIGVGHPIPLLSGVTAVVGLGGGSMLYARYRGFDLGLSGPRRRTWGTALAAVLAPALLVGLASVVGTVAFGVTVSEVTQRGVATDLSVGDVLGWTVLPAAFLGLGYGLLVCGVVVESVRTAVDPEDTAVLATALLAFFWLLPVGPVTRLPADLGAAYELLVTLVFGAAFGMGVGVVYDALDAGRRVTTLSAREVAVVFVASVGVVGVATGLNSVPEVVREGLWIAALGIAVVGYLRTRSAWVAALALAGFVTALRLVPYVEATLGVAGL